MPFRCGKYGDAFDVDVRGFHTVPADEYAYLTRPADEVTVNMVGTTEGFEAYADVDLRSYELRTFGSLLYGANYNVVELVLEAPVLVNGVALEINAARSLVREHDDVEADIRVLAEEIAAAPTALVGELIEHKREAIDEWMRKVRL